MATRARRRRGPTTRLYHRAGPVEPTGHDETSWTQRCLRCDAILAADPPAIGRALEGAAAGDDVAVEFVHVPATAYELGERVRAASLTVCSGQLP